MNFLANIYDVRQTQKIKDIVDKYMQQRPPPRQVFANHIFGAKPPIHMIYPPFAVKQCTSYDKHHGPVLGVATSPFNKRLFLTCSSDSSIRLYDVHDKKAVASFEPCFGEYLNCVQWSPFRPSVFACVSNTGTLYIYDLVRSKQAPFEVIKHDNDSSVAMKYRQASEIKFNPRQRDYIAVGYHDKMVRIYRLSRVLSNMNSDDHKVLQSFLEEKKI